MDNHNASGSAAYQIDDAQKRIIRPDGSAVRVGPTEFAFLSFLHANKGKLFTSDKLLENIWDNPYHAYSLVQITVWNIRRNVGLDAVDNVRGYGYGVGIE